MDGILLLFTHTCPVTEFAVASHLNTANSCCHHVFLRHFRFQKCLPVNSNWYFSPFLRQDTDSGQIESFSRYIYEPGTDSGAESSFYSTTITRMIFVSATGSWRLARVTTPAVATTISPSLTIPFSFSNSTDASVDSARFAWNGLTPQ